MAALNLFPARIAFVDNQGRLTPEAYRALAMLFERTGGEFGDQGVDVFAVFSTGGQDAPLVGESFMQPVTETYLTAIEVSQPSLEWPLLLPEVQQPATASYEGPEVFQPVDAKWLDSPLVRGDLTAPKTAGMGIRVDTDIPTFGWRDILGRVSVRSIGASDPALAVYRGSIRQFMFSNAVTNEVFVEAHIPHDYVPGSDVHIHVHWSQIVVDTGGSAAAPGDAKWSFDLSYAKGHNQAPFSAPVTATVTQTASGTQYQHMIAEVQISAASPSGSQIDSDLLEPDGVILVRAWRDPADAADTLNQNPFLHFVDVHYQSTNIATKQKSPDFYV